MQFIIPPLQKLEWGRLFAGPREGMWVLAGLAGREKHTGTACRPHVQHVVRWSLQLARARAHPHPCSLLVTMLPYIALLALSHGQLLVLLLVLRGNCVLPRCDPFTVQLALV